VSREIEARPGPLTWAGIIAATCLLLAVLDSVLWLVLPFLFALPLYYLLYPALRRIMFAGVSRESACLIVTGVFLLVALILGLLVAPRLVARFADTGASVERYVAGGVALLERTLAALEQSSGLLARAKLSSLVTAWLNEFSATFTERHLQPALVAAAGWLPALLLTPFFAFFFLRDGKNFQRFLARAVPNAYFEKTLFLTHEVSAAARGYFEGLLLLTVLDTVCLALGLWWLGMPGPLILGFAAAVLAWVPYVGSIAGCVLVVLVAATDFPGHPEIAWQAVALFILVRMLDDFVFMPLTIGRSLRLPPVISVLMLFVGGAIAGVVGLMLVLPLLGVVMVVGITMGEIVTDPRLRARHRYAQRLRARGASVDLSV